MYRSPEHHKPRRRRHVVAIVSLLLIVLAGVGAYGYHYFMQDTATVIQNSAGTTKQAVIPDNQIKHFDQGGFSFDLPSDWALTKHDSALYDLYSFKATVTNADNRYLDIYVDKIPLKLAVNKEVALRSQGDVLSHGEVSENCLTFAGTTTTSSALTIPTTWQGVNFLCDNDNKTRNVVGTGSPNSVNAITLKGQSGASHQFFYVYTDNNYTPDYAIFYHMLESFVVK